MTNTTSLLALADQCVKCGLCLPQCPTYTLNLNENESPRGRISLIQALAEKQLDASNILLAHLDHCLLCRRCERVCPSQVKYGEIIQQARSKIPALKPNTSVLGRFGLWFIEKPQRQAQLRKLLRFYQRSGLQWMLRKTRLLTLLKLNQIERRLPDIQPAFKLSTGIINSEKTIANKKSIALFTGCTQTLFDSNAITSAYQLLTRLGYNVITPEEQVCCGALHNNQGFTAKSQRLLKTNDNVFTQALYQTGFEKILYLSTGCGAFISEQKNESDSFERFEEITDFILQDKALAKLKFKPLLPLFNNVAVHLPCSQKNVLRQDNSAFKLLQHIPHITLHNLEQSGCCGAGGSTMVTHPEIADQIRQPLVDNITQQNCNLVVTTNPGCQLHLQQGFNAKNTHMQVIHPITLLAQQLEA